MDDALVSVVIPTLNEGRNLIDTVAYVLQNSNGQPLEVVVVDDGSTDGSSQKIEARFGDANVRVIQSGGIGVPGARNAGAAVAEGQVLIFLDGHCYVPAGWLQPLLDALYVEPAVAMVGPTFADINPPHVAACGNTFKDESLERAWLPIRKQVTYVPFHGGGCQVVRSDAFHTAGGYDQGMTRWGSQDLELCLRLWLLGYSVVAQPASIIYHLFRKQHPYAVNGADVLYNKLRMAVVHFDAGRLQKVIRYLQQFRGADQILARVMTDATWSFRQQMLATRQRDVDWLFTRFQIPI